MPGASPSLRATRSHLANCASVQREVRCRVLRPVRARVGHRVAEHDAVEVVADVVVVRDRVGVAPLAVPAAGSRASSAGGAGGGPERRPAAARPRAQRLLRGGVDGDARARASGRRPARAPRSAGDEVALDVDVAGDVGPGEAELVRRPHAAAAARAGCGSTSCSGRFGPTDPAAVPAFDGHRSLGAEGGPYQRFDGVGDGHDRRGVGSAFTGPFLPVARTAMRRDVTSRALASGSNPDESEH